MAQRTKNAIRQSFMELLAERPFDKITIGDIAQRSEITRNAFYYYYQDIYALVEDIFALVEDIFALELEQFTQKAAAYTSWQDAFRAAIAFALDNRRAVLHIYHSSSRETLERYYRQTILSAMTDFVHMMAQGLDVPEGKITALSRFYAAALEGLTSQWLRDGMTEDLAPFIADLGELLDGNIRLSLERCVRKEN